MKEEDHSGLLPAYCVAQQEQKSVLKLEKHKVTATVNVPKSQEVQPERQWKPNLATSPLKLVLCRDG